MYANFTDLRVNADEIMKGRHHRLEDRRADKSIFQWRKMTFHASRDLIDFFTLQEVLVIKSPQLSSRAEKT